MRSTLILVVPWTLSSKRGHLTLGLQIQFFSDLQTADQKKRQNKVSEIRKFQKFARAEGQWEEEEEGNHQGMMQEELRWRKYGDDSKSDGTSPLKYIAHAFFCSLATVIYDYTPVGSMQSEDTWQRLVDDI